MIAQMFTFTITMPLYSLLHILTSPVAKQFPGRHATRVLLIPDMDLKILPLSLALGYIMPGVLMLLPAPDILSVAVHQKMIALWQPFPIWSMLTHWTLKALGNFISSHMLPSNIERKPRSQGQSYLAWVNIAYYFILLICCTTHLPVLFIALCPVYLIPNHFPRVADFAMETFASVYVPYIPYLAGSRPTSFETCTKNFLQWDVYIGATGLLLWGGFMFQNARLGCSLSDPATGLPLFSAKQILTGTTATRNQRFWEGLRFKLAASFVLGGPFAALTVLLWERDLIVKQKVKHGQ